MLKSIWFIKCIQSTCNSSSSISETAYKSVPIANRVPQLLPAQIRVPAAATIQNTFPKNPIQSPILGLINPNSVSSAFIPSIQQTANKPLNSQIENPNPYRWRRHSRPARFYNKSRFPIRKPNATTWPIQNPQFWTHHRLSHPAAPPSTSCSLLWFIKASSNQQKRLNPGPNLNHNQLQSD